MKNLFLTGGLGQDGKLLSKIISKKKFKIFYFINRKPFLKRKGINYIKINLLKKERIEKVFKLYKPDTIIHLASNNPAYNEKNYKKFYLENINISYNLFKLAFSFNKKIRFIFISSSQIFKNKSGKVTENSVKKVTTPYTKFRIEFDNFLNIKKANFTNIILFNHDSKYRNKKFLIPRIMFALKKKNISFLKEIIKANIYGDFSHADDICEGINKVLLYKKKIKKVILSSNKPTSVNSIINYVIKKNKLKLNLNLKSPSKKKPFLIGNNSLAKKIFKWNPKKNIYIAANEIYKSL